MRPRRTRRPGRASAATAVAIAAAAALAAAGPADAASVRGDAVARADGERVRNAVAARGAAPRVALGVSLGRGARLGQRSPLRLGLRIARRAPAATAIEIRYPAGLGVTTSGLGLEPCERPASDFVAVVLDGGRDLAGCSPQAVMAHGTALAEVRIDGERITDERGSIILLSGPVAGDRLGLVAYVKGQNPIGAMLAYAGAVGPAPSPWGGRLTIRLPPFGNDLGAEIALVGVTLTLGHPDIVYTARTRTGWRRWRPEAIGLPDDCPSGGLRFAATISFAGGARSSARTVVPCPRGVRR